MMSVWPASNTPLDCVRDTRIKTPLIPSIAEGHNYVAYVCLKVIDRICP